MATAISVSVLAGQMVRDVACLRRVGSLFAVATVLTVVAALPGAARGDALGTLVITEVMLIPAEGVGVPEGQWVEVYNTQDDSVALAGWIVECEPVSGPSMVWVVAGLTAGSVGPHAYGLLGWSQAVLSNGGVEVDGLLTGSGELPFDGCVLRVADPLANLVDEAAVGSSFGLPGLQAASLSLEPGAQTSESNDDSTRWCISLQAFDSAKAQMAASPGSPGKACDGDADGLSEDQGDCDDANEWVLPGVLETCNGIDDNCNGFIDEYPMDGAPVVSELGVCADAQPECLGAAGWFQPPIIGYELLENTCDGLDNDCDGAIDEQLTNSCGYCGPADVDLCDGADNDCDGLTDEDAVDPPPEVSCAGQGVGVCLKMTPVCVEEWRCIYPVGFEEVTEVSCDGLDNNCDGSVDEGFPVGEPCTIGLGLCAVKGVTACAPDKRTTACAGTPITGSEELCGDNLDNDCDGLVDEGFPVGKTCYAGEGICRTAGKYFCAADNSLGVVCGAEPQTPTTEVCGNGLDDDCDGVVDESSCSSRGSSFIGCQASDCSCLSLALPASILAGIVVGLLAGLRLWLLLRPSGRRRTNTSGWKDSDLNN